MDPFSTVHQGRQLLSMPPNKLTSQAIEILNLESRTNTLMQTPQFDRVLKTSQKILVTNSNHRNFEMPSRISLGCETFHEEKASEMESPQKLTKM
jgi:hypothetical protein